MRLNPLWAKAPLVLRQWPAILTSVAAGAVLLGMTAASPALFLSSSGTDALDRAIGDSTRYGAGLTIAFHDARMAELPGHEGRVPTVATRDRVLRRAVAGVAPLDKRILTMLGDSMPVRSASVEAAEAYPVRLVHRTGALEHVRVVEGLAQAQEGAAWIQDVTADTLRIGVGDSLVLQPEHRQDIRLRVAGIYEALANSPPTPYWEPLADHFRPPTVDAPLPPTFVLVDRNTVESLFDRVGQHDADFQWEFPLSPSHSLDLISADELGRDLRAIGTSILNTRSPVGKFFRCRTCPVPTPIRVNVLSTLEEDIIRARQTTSSLKPSIELLAVAALLTALVVLAAAGLYGVNRRVTEIRFLSARGWSPSTLGAKTAAECALPVVAGTAFGLVAAAVGLERFGPGDRIDSVALRDAALFCALAVPAALIVIGVAAAVASARISNAGSTSRRAFKIPWEIPVLAIAGVALERLIHGEGLLADASTDVERVSPWLLVFPVLVVGGGAGLTARAFRKLLAKVRNRAQPSSAASYLALNRLATARWLAIMLISASSLALGIFLYAQTMATSVRATTLAKSMVFTGSDVAVPVDRQYMVPESFPWPYTLVTNKIDAGRLEPSGQTIDFLAIDPASFERAAFWDESFSTRSLREILEALDNPSDTTLRAVVAGDLPPGAGLEIGGVPIPLEVVARVDAFPGQYLDRTLFIVNRETAGIAIEGAGGLDPTTVGGAIASLWIKGDPDGIVASLGDLGFGPDDSLSAVTVLRHPGFVAVTRTFRFFEILGILAALLVLVGTVLYIQTRQRGRALAYALARRMGLRRRSHYAALVIELATMLGLSLLTGVALGALAARLVYARVDLLPNIPPHPLLRIPLNAAVPVAAALVATTLIGALRAQRTAERADIAEVLRSGA